jgi:hypothetical protein
MAWNMMRSEHAEQIRCRFESTENSLAKGDPKNWHRTIWSSYVVYIRKTNNRSLVCWKCVKVLTNRLTKLCISSRTNELIPCPFFGCYTKFILISSWLNGNKQRKEKRLTVPERNCVICVVCMEGNHIIQKYARKKIVVNGLIILCY